MYSVQMFSFGTHITKVKKLYKSEIKQSNVGKIGNSVWTEKFLV